MSEPFHEHNYQDGKPVHTVAWKHDRDSIYGTITCTARPGSPCRMVCPEECPTWPCEHDLIDGGCCNAVDFMLQAWNVQETFGGKEEVPVRDGPVFITWEPLDELYVWTYIEGRLGAEDE